MGAVVTGCLDFVIRRFTASSGQGLAQSFTAVVYSRGNNTVEANASNTFGMITLFSGR